MNKFYFDTFLNLKSPQINKQVDLQELLGLIKIGDGNAQLISYMRSLKKEDDNYRNSKLMLPAVSWNARFNEKRDGDDIKELTGYIYFDKDGLTEEQISQCIKELKEFPFVVAIWRSVGGRGLGILAHVEGATKINFTSVYKEMAAQMGLDYDKNAAKLVQPNVISYDPDIWINDGFEAYVYIENSTVSGSLYLPKYESSFSQKSYSYVSTTTEVKKASLANINKQPYIYDLVKPKSRPLVFSSLENIEFDGKDYLVFKDGIDEIKVFWRKTIKVGGRNNALLAVAINLVYLNFDTDIEHLFNWMYRGNIYHCNPPVDYKQIVQILRYCVQKHMKGELQPILNKRYIIFNPQKPLTVEEKLSIVGKEMRKLKLYRNRNLIIEAICLLTENGQKVTQLKVVGITGLSRSTIQRHWDYCGSQVA